MNQAQQLAHRFEEALLSGKWVTNTNYKEILEDITLEEATKSYKGLNTIAQLTFHINYYIKGVLVVLKGGELTITDAYSFDIPILTTAKDWQDLRDELLKNALAFSQQLSTLSDKHIEEPFVNPKYGNYNRNMNGMIEHCYYHLGQMVLIKKLLRA